ncbi:MAG TPA: EAL domain-containing protein [Bacillota bacterium]|nr:EAL domain-containing protein [Bacillota bacterium]
MFLQNIRKNIRNPFKPIIHSESRTQIMKIIGNELENKRSVVLFYMDIAKLTEIESQFGYSAANQVISCLEKSLPSVCQEIFKGGIRLVALDKLWADDYVIYVSSDTPAIQERIDNYSIKLKVLVEEKLNERLSGLNLSPVYLHIGYSLLKGIDLSREIYKSVRDAHKMAKTGLLSKKYRRIQRFLDIMDKEEIHMHFQPIVSLHSANCLGWEALARGPVDDYFHSPLHLFSYADEMKRSFQLELMCRRKALEKSTELDPKRKLFLNFDPRTMMEGKELVELTQYDIPPNQIVLEITERHAISNYETFKRSIEQYRKKGYLIAVDDAGAGYSSLEMIASIFPDYIKMDMSLIRDIDVDPVKQALMETFVNFSAKVGCKIIAEGIETENELQKLIGLGVDYGQGFFLGRPKKDLLNYEETAAKIIEESIYKKNLQHPFMMDGNNRIFSIVSKTMTVDIQTKVKQVHQIMEGNYKIDSIVIMGQEKPVGLIMRNQLYQILSSQYGIPLYYEKPIYTIMDHSPLIVDKEDLIDEVAKRSMEREPLHLYDVVIVTDQQRYIGIVTVQMLLDSITKSKLEIAAYSNPLTGLPGNLNIEKQLVQSLNNGKEFVVVYCDLDHFKWFNDKYGFELGDKIILRTAQLIETAVKINGNPKDFIGHIGGDDYIFITTIDRLKAIERYIIQNFTEYFQEFNLHETDENRMGLSISIAAVHCSQDRFKSLYEISEAAAQIKKLAKQIQGSSFVSDLGIFLDHQ